MVFGLSSICGFYGYENKSSEYILRACGALCISIARQKILSSLPLHITIHSKICGIQKQGQNYTETFSVIIPSFLSFTMSEKFSIQSNFNSILSQCASCICTSCSLKYEIHMAALLRHVTLVFKTSDIIRSHFVFYVLFVCPLYIQIQKNNSD